MGSGGAEYNTALASSRDPNAWDATAIPGLARVREDGRKEGAQETVGATVWPELPRSSGYCSVLYLVS